MLSIIQDGYTGLMKACAEGHTPAVRVLLSEGKADPNITDKGETPLVTDTSSSV